MLESLYSTTLNKKHEINNEFTNLRNYINSNELEDFIEWSPNKIKQDKTFISTDGSSNQKKFIAHFVYAVESECIYSKPGQPISKEAQCGDINTFSTAYPEKYNNFISLHMDILELKSTIKTLNKYPNIDYILLDGSIKGKLNNFKVNTNISKDIRNNLNNHIKLLEKQLEDDSFNLGLYYDDIKNDLKNEINNKFPNCTYENIELDIKEYFVSLELLCCINHLMSKYSGQIICIAKSNSTKEFFNQKVPDMAVLEYATTKSGYVKPKITENKKLVVQSDDKKLSIEYPLYKKEIPTYTYITTFARLEDKKSIIKIEIPLVHMMECPRAKKVISELLNELYSCSINGYPHILKKVHDDVVIKNKDMDKIIHNLELIEYVPRRMLNY